MHRVSKIFIFILFIFVLPIFADINVYFAPKGGFHRDNNKRTIMTVDGKEVQATLNNTLVQLINEVEEYGTIKIAMYAFGYRPVQEALIKAAKERKVKVKLILDAIAKWTQEIRSEFKRRILEEHKLAKKEGRRFDFQLKEIYPQSMVDRHRIKEIRDGKIYGTMHEKFGICFPKGCKIPLSGFCGSANISWSAGQVFAENRVIFKNEPSMGRQLAEEFARLWNEFGTPVTDNCESEIFIPAVPQMGDVEIASNSKPINEKKFQRLDEKLMDLMDQVNFRNGTLDVAIFSFTHVGLANKLLDLAKFHPNIKVRILMDQTQLISDKEHQGVLGPYMEEVAKFKDIKNFQVRYKWRSNTYAWDEETNSCQLIHWRNLLLHHKCLVVNRHLMGLGSYNWSSSAEFRNFENIMFFNGDIPEHQRAVDRFIKEYDLIWNSLKTDKPITQRITSPQVVTGPQGRKLHKLIVKTYNDPDCKNIMKVIDANVAGCSKQTLVHITGLNAKKLEKKLEKLVKATLIAQEKQGNEIIYKLAD